MVCVVCSLFFVMCIVFVVARSLLFVRCYLLFVVCYVFVVLRCALLLALWYVFFALCSQFHTFDVCGLLLPLSKLLFLVCVMSPFFFKVSYVFARMCLLFMCYVFVVLC